jgi:hypothetical protein
MGLVGVDVAALATVAAITAACAAPAPAEPMGQSSTS